MANDLVRTTNAKLKLLKVTTTYRLVTLQRRCLMECRRRPSSSKNRVINNNNINNDNNDDDNNKQHYEQ